MSHKIKSMIISLIVIAVLFVALLIGVQNGAVEKLTKEMPTIAAQSERQSATQPKEEPTFQNNEELNEEEKEMASLTDNFMRKGEKAALDKSKPYGGLSVVHLGETFELRYGDIGYNENDKSTYSSYNVTVHSCKMSRECDFDINRIDYGLENKKQYMDENHNFISNYYYVTVEVEITKAADNIAEIVEDGVQSVWYMMYLNEDGTHYLLKYKGENMPGGVIGSDVEDSHGHIELSNGETKTVTFYFLISDVEYNNDNITLAINFNPVQSPYKGAWVIVKEAKKE